jgi:hypothetical protein
MAAFLPRTTRRAVALLPRSVQPCSSPRLARFLGGISAACNSKKSSTSTPFDFSSCKDFSLILAVSYVCLSELSNDQVPGSLQWNSCHGTMVGASFTGLHPLIPPLWWRPAPWCTQVLSLARRSLLGPELWSGLRCVSGSRLESGMGCVFWVLPVFDSVILFAGTEFCVKMCRYNVVLSNCSACEFCIIHNGACIGQDGKHMY